MDVTSGRSATPDVTSMFRVKWMIPIPHEPSEVSLVRVEQVSFEVRRVSAVASGGSDMCARARDSPYLLDFCILLG